MICWAFHHVACLWLVLLLPSARHSCLVDNGCVEEDIGAPSFTSCHDSFDCPSADESAASDCEQNSGGSCRWDLSGLLQSLRPANEKRRYFVINDVSHWLGANLETALYRQASGMRRAKSQHLNVSRLVLRLPLPNPLKSGVKLWMQMLLEQHRQAMLQLHLSD